jgi:hypothetical protein
MIGFDGLHGIFQRLCHHHHPGTAAVGSIINRFTGVMGIIPWIPKAQ